MFDFSSYLAAVVSVPFKVTALTGGLTNATVRVSFVEPTTLFNISEPTTSIVLKHAPPYIAADPTLALSPDRQRVEAAALGYLAETQQIQDLLAQFPALRIPRLIHHDTTADVLWISDLGESQTLSQWLSSAPDEAAVRAIASSLGQFVTRFWEATASPAPETIALFRRRSEGPAVFLSTTALKIMSERGIEDAEALSARIRVGIATETTEACLGMVDFWPGSILIGSDGTLGLVDWEYFGVSTPGAEIGMLGLHFIQATAWSNQYIAAHLHILTASTSTEEAAIAATRTFIAAFDAAGPGASVYLKRQALIAYGREMVTALEFFATDLDEKGKSWVFEAGVRALGASSDDKVICQVYELMQGGWL
ncbi:kinase-like domain-containing protein [Mycena amicta]|nr:kinase-like domain-containing protein [Mycena amicta]